MNIAGYGLLLKSYMKYVHTRPYKPNLTLLDKNLEQSVRNRQLAIYLMFGIPLTLFVLRKSGNLYKDMASINFPLGSSTDSQTDNNISNNNSSLFLLLSNITKKIPSWVKLFFRLLLLTILVLKLLGISILEFLNCTLYIKIYSYITCSLLISYQLLNLYLLQKFSNNNNIKIPEVLPNFIINWLKEFEIIGSKKKNINNFKQIYYIEISIYLVILILTTFV